MQSTGSLFEGIILPSIESGDGTTLRKCSPLGIVKPVKGPIWSFRRGKENTTVVKELLEDAIERGLDREERYLTVVEGSRERRTEVRPVLGIEPKHCHMMAAEKLRADDTPVPVLAPGRGKTRTGRLWTYVRDDRPAGDTTPTAMWFAYPPDRKAEHPKAHLNNFTGTLQADGYAGYDQVYEGGGIQEAGSMANVKRKLCDLHRAHKSPVEAEALERIGALYAIEKDIR